MNQEIELPRLFDVSQKISEDHHRRMEFLVKGIPWVNHEN
jgi:hypothetical protein